MNIMDVRVAQSDRDFANARALFLEYGEAIGGHLCFQDFQHELDHLPETYGPRTGALLLGSVDAIDVGCVGLRSLDAETCEMKRMYVKPSARGSGLGRELAAAILESARALGYRRMILDTLPTMRSAQAIYRSLGFRIAPASSGIPPEGAIRMECDLLETRAAL